MATLSIQLGAEVWRPKRIRLGSWRRVPVPGALLFARGADPKVAMRECATHREIVKRSFGETSPVPRANAIIRSLATRDWNQEGHRARNQLFHSLRRSLAGNPAKVAAFVRSERQAGDQWAA